MSKLTIKEKNLHMKIQINKFIKNAMNDEILYLIKDNILYITNAYVFIKTDDIQLLDDIKAKIKKQKLTERSNLDVIVNEHIDNISRVGVEDTGILAPTNKRMVRFFVSAPRYATVIAINDDLIVADDSRIAYEAEANNEKAILIGKYKGTIIGYFPIVVKEEGSTWASKVKKGLLKCM